MRAEGLPSPRFLAVVYFLVLGGAGAYVPFFALHLARSGLSASAAGALIASMAVIQTLSSPVVGALADRTGQRTRLLQLLVLGSTLGVLAFALSGQVWTLGLSLAAIAMCRPPAVVLLDAEVVSVLEASGRPPETYGSVRLWGSVGFLVFANVAGLIAEETPSHAILLSSALLGATGLLASRLPGRRGPLQDPGRASAIRLLLADPPSRTLLLACVLHGTGLFIYDVYLSTLLQHRGMPVAATGPAVAVAVASEILAMGLARRLLLGVGPWRLIALGSLAMAVRLVATAIVPGVGPLIAVQVLHALAFGMWWVSLVEALRQRMPEHVRAGSTALAVSAAYGLGPLGGATLAGFLLDSAGAVTLFLVGACAALAAAIVGWVAHLQVVARIPPRADIVHLGDAAGVGEKA